LGRAASTDSGEKELILKSVKIESKTLAGIAVLALLLAAGCAKAPQTELEAAQTALAGAEAAGAANYASADWDAAREALTAAEAEIQVQNDKLGVFRSYDQAIEKLNDATAKATAAQGAAVAAKEAARQEAETAKVSLEASIADAQTALGELQKCRRQPKGFAADLAALRGQVDAIAGQSAGVQAAIDAEDFLGANTTVAALQQQVDALLADVEAAGVKIGCPTTSGV
jgi:chromosome segregation ATPase